MSTRGQSTDIETWDGVGRVYQAGEPIARVYYTLETKQVYIARKAHEEPGIETTQERISGYIIVDTGTTNLAEKSDLTLRLQDGRQLDFRAAPLDPSWYIFEVKPRSRFYGK